MTQEEKQLILIDICARLPHDVEAQVINNIEGESKPFVVNKPITFDDIDAFVKNDVVIDIKPYLRQMSSMTKEELKEFSYTILQQPDLDAVRNWQNLSIDDLEELTKVLDWLNTHNFDYRGLIEKGLALEAPEGMYKTKQ